MNLRKRAVGGIIVAGSLVMMCTIAEAGPVAGQKEGTQAQTEVNVETVALKTDGTAGVIVCFNQVESGALNYLGASEITVAYVSKDMVAAAEEAGEEEQTSEEEQPSGEEQISEEEQPSEEEQISEEEQLWQNRLMADVDEYLNIRAAADENAEVVAKLYKGDVAEIIEAGDEWTHIRSGNADGYVYNAYCVSGMDAYAYATANFDTKAEVATEALRIRSEASTEADVVTTAYEGASLTVDADAEAVDGWVAVECKGQTGYVSADYVTTELTLGEAVTIEEEQAEQARLAAEEAAKAAAQTTEIATVQKEAAAANVDEVTLLAALIQCEAGSECYEGQVAVGAVVMNRVRSGSYPGSISGVIYESGQFSPAASGSLATTIANGPSASCVQAAQEAINGTDNTGGAVSFRRASSGHTGVVIGNHVFF
jgi:uncharacterized protein YgiM (DUF1202 family)